MDDNDSIHPRTHEVSIGNIHYDKSSNSNNEVNVKIDCGGSESKYITVNMHIECFRVFYQLAAAGHIIDLTDYCGYGHKAKKKIEKGDVLYKRLMAHCPQAITPEDLLAVPEPKKISLVPSSSDQSHNEVAQETGSQDAGYSANFWRKEQKKIRQNNGNRL